MTIKDMIISMNTLVAVDSVFIIFLLDIMVTSVAIEFCLPSFTLPLRLADLLDSSIVCSSYTLINIK